MYQVEGSSQVIKATKGGQLRFAAVPSAVLGLGWTSFFTDISSEMVASILPVFLYVSLQMSPLQFGLLDGLQQGASAIVRLIGGLLADRWRRYKEIALAGYAISALVKAGYLIVGTGWGWIAVLIIGDRVGKGIRTAPRDALISLYAARDNLGTAFGVHRALDTAGAMLGPICAFGLLALLPGQFSAVFVVSLCVAIVGVAVLWLFVPSRPGTAASESLREQTPADRVCLRSAAALLKQPSFRGIVLAGTALGLATISDALLYLSIQQRMQLNVGFFPLLFVVTAAAFMVLAVPMGRLADRYGRGKVFIAGHVVLLFVYSILLHDEIGWGWLVFYLALHGSYYAATDGVLMALASQVLPERLRGSGLALLGTAVGLARLLSSVIFGILWTVFGLEATVKAFGVLLLVAIVVGTLYVLRKDSHVTAT